MSDDPRLKEPDKPVWQMSPVERLGEQLRRVAVLAAYLQAGKSKVRIEGTTIIAETSINNYFVDFADYDPRFIKVQIIYDVPTDVAILRAAAAEATNKSFGAKATFEQFGTGFRLRFIAEVFAANVSELYNSIGVYQAFVEDCRERFWTIAHAS